MPEHCCLVDIALLLVLYALTEVANAMQFDGERTIDELFNAIGVVVISTALIVVAKFLAEEEVLRKRHSLPSAREIRRSLTKFLSIIAIAICMEALVVESQPHGNVVKTAHAECEIPYG